MSETIPDYSPPLKLTSTIATGVDLAPVVINPSRLLWRLQCAVYVAMLLSASIALLPFMLTAFYWPMLWLVFLLSILLAVRSAWRASHASPITLSVRNQSWRLCIADAELMVAPCEEMLLWANLIILPVRETLTGKMHRILILPDSMPAEDWRRLRVWLRMGMKTH